MLTRAFYQSRITGPFGPLVLLTRQRDWVARNRAAGITSFLYHDATRIFQVVEGPPDAVEATLCRIRDSALHTDMQVRASLQVTDRTFQRWAFGATNHGDVDFVGLAGGQDLFALDVLAAERLLAGVAAAKRRVVRNDTLRMAVRNFRPGHDPEPFARLA